ncbi:MAG: lysophospholipid acyltransferase family protein [Muribaculaceae bacterium]|nr:lysophospholipid acyltransferase family protein [Muribaculaceae bacterium]
MTREVKKITLGDRLLYGILYACVWMMSLLPFAVLYLISDLLAGFLHSVLRYRRRVVRENLASSFPEKSERELARIERRFYRFLTDYFMETVKMMTMSERTVKCRMHVENPEMITEAVEADRNVTLLLGHYCNWEWVSSLPLWFDKGVGAQVYHYLHNHAMNELFMRLRTRFHAHNIEMADIMRRLIEWKREGVPTVTGFIADQSPSLDIHLFVDFLHHDTPVFTGPERIAKFLDSRVLFIHLTRPKRGYYSLRFVKITDGPKKEPVFDLTRRYFELLEENITEAPEYWLWSHRRWKRTRADFNAYWGANAEKQLSHL